jgi:hypothetical protein
MAGFVTDREDQRVSVHDECDPAQVVGNRGTRSACDSQARAHPSRRTCLNAAAASRLELAR